MSVLVDVGAVQETGVRLRSAAPAVPDPVAGLGESSGSPGVDESVDDFVRSTGHCLVGAATAVYTLGQDAVSAAAEFVAADRQVAS